MATIRIGGAEWRVAQGGAVTRRTAGRSWEPVTRAELLSHDADGELWEWLREQSVRRPSPSGRSLPEAERGGCRVRLDEAATAHADALAERWGCGRPEAVSRALELARARQAKPRGGSPRERREREPGEAAHHAGDAGPVSSGRW